ncbi:DNA-3-methyladenine glycosylase [Candidatus Hamiltonella defensa]|uniref:DNA-3-methyladenine glycosylase n=1 Tax=Candidatus Williamhamiltonella defendens TaxID=138072 RepID=UPI0020C6AE0C|nr:DNA-3-methyladenine glycosylase [Candidatus Hamiltonella defensa]
MANKKAAMKRKSTGINRCRVRVFYLAHFMSVIRFANEVEAYVGQEDPACHAARGYTPRTAVMFGTAGFSWVYLVYGMYHCLNIVTEREGFPAAVLIRGIDLYKPTVISLDGPGKLCKKLNITKNNNQIDLTQSHDFCVYNSTIQPESMATPRIGIKVGTDKLWRLKTI